MAKSKKKPKEVEAKMTKKKSDEKIEEASQVSDQTNEQPTVEQTVDPMTQMQIEFNQLNDKHLRLNAEFQNYRKRVEKEKSEIFKYGTEKVMIEMLPIMDNFERALAASDQENSEGKVIEGIKLIKKSLDDFFDRNGVKKIDALNQAFDPIKHHAVMTVESEEHTSEHVIEVLQDGYLLHDKVIRPSMVKVSN